MQSHAGRTSVCGCRIFHLHTKLKQKCTLDRMGSIISCTYSTNPDEKRKNWWDIYHRKRQKVEEIADIAEVKPNGIFANNETCLKGITVYGFDYDYTLASYKKSLHGLLYNLGRSSLIHKYRYPDEISKLEFDIDAAVRGLHYDIRKGLLMKLDSFHNIQLGTVYRGLTQVPDREVIALYDGTHVSLEDMNTFYGTGPMYQLVDLFAPPEMNLLINVTENMCSMMSGDAGMRYMIGDDWMDLFEVVITNARKPKFFNEASRIAVKTQGNFSLFRQMTGWYGSKVLYFGDHVYSDLADPSLKHGWRTGAIIPELESEIIKANSKNYTSAVRWLNIIQDLIEDIQSDDSPEAVAIKEEWLKERQDLRNFTKALFNPKFGSIFRTYHNPTYFSRRLARFADIYMSNVVNLLEYSVEHTFYPRRMALPHEPHEPYICV
ncbi:hypothetical protein KUTeg_012594 [Tegillarca granosa]|uniref:5'-nucleotidase domain-containing protein 3 n=1 Tax=Tegillarca granosa TaxID=220873 RepID=A0ABQ9F005_TEGGR|nr:hypothetical protein KUTeg_012594 [Tegillarca granosa]